METQLSNPLFIVLKVTLACSVALLLDQALGNPDSVSSTFVTVLCISPTVLIGLRNAWAQMLGSLVGGLWGTAANFLDWPVLIALPLAVGGAVATSFGLRIASGYPVAAFTALFLILVQRGTPLETFETRFLALFIALVSSFLINALVSAMLYRDIYRRRLEKVEQHVFSSLPEVIAGQQAAADKGFELLGILQQQLKRTLFELKWRRAWKTHAEISRLLQRTRLLSYLLHLVLDLSYLQHERPVDQEDVQNFVRWIQAPGSTDFPFLPDTYLGLQRRILHVLQKLEPPDAPA